MKPIPLSALAPLLDLKHESQVMVKGYAIDSRLVREGDLFFALRGERVDGHDFLEEVAGKRASGVVVAENYRGETFGLPALHVPDVLNALQELAKRVQAKRTGKIIAITGSLGKTTTKGFVKTLLEGQFSVFASPKSYNSQATVPLSLLMAEGTEDFLLIEMGMTEGGQIKKLVEIAPPHFALLTSVAVQHVTHFHDGLAGIAREKAAIFSHPKTELGIVHKDLHHFDEVVGVGSCEKLSFSVDDQKADFFLEEGDGCVRIHVEGASYDLKVDLPMKAYYANVAAAVALARAVGVEWPVIQECVSLLTLPPMRFERIEKGGIVFINDAYNANPDSMRAAIENLPVPEKGGRKIAVLGDMDALGMYTEVGHISVAEVALECVDRLLCLGEHGRIMEKVWQQGGGSVEWFACREALGKRLKDIVRAGDVVLLKGSRSHGLEVLLECF